MRDKSVSNIRVVRTKSVRNIRDSKNRFSKKYQYRVRVGAVRNTSTGKVGSLR